MTESTYAPFPVPPYQQPPALKKGNGLAITALVLGISALVLSWVPGLGIFLGILAAVFGGIALAKCDNKIMAGFGVGLGALTLFINIIVIAAISGGTDKPTASLPTDNATHEQPVVTKTTQPEVPVPATTKPAAPAKVVDAGPASSFGDGNYEVGVDVRPGRYRSAGAQEGLFEFCSVSTETASGDMVDWETANAHEQVLITLKKGQMVEASGCETFKLR